jgi:hypothetical protein
MNLLESDLYLVSRLVFAKQKEVFVLDPGNQCISNIKTGLHFVRQRKEVENLAKLNKSFFLINLSGASTFSFPIDFNKVEGLISFNRRIETSTDYFHTLLHIQTDENDRLKWLLSEKHKKADFLTDTDENKSLVDVNNFFSVIPFVYNFFRLKLGFVGSIAKGKIQVLLKERYLFSFLENLDYDSFSVNIRPSFDAGVIHARFFRQNKWVFSAKRAFNPLGRKKLSNENKVLKLLQQENFTDLAVPVSTEFPDGNLLQFSEHFRQTDYYGIQKRINSRFTNAVFEYIRLKPGKIKLKKLLVENKSFEILEHLRQIIEKKKFPRGLSVINYVKVYTELIQLINKLDLEQEIRTSIVNKDLTPAHIAYSNTRIHLLKWENSELQYPVLFDLFEYSFSYMEDFDSPDIEYLTNDLLSLYESPQIKELIEKTGLDFKLQLDVFALLRFGPELMLFLNKKVLTPERNLRLFVWASFFENTKNLFEN